MVVSYGTIMLDRNDPGVRHVTIAIGNMGDGESVWKVIGNGTKDRDDGRRGKGKKWWEG